MAGPRFSAEYNFGHLLTVATIFVTVSGAAIATYTTVSSKITDHETRITTLEKTQEKSSAEFTTAQSKSYDLLLDISNKVSRLEGVLATQARTTK